MFDETLIRINYVMFSIGCTRRLAYSQGSRRQALESMFENSTIAV